MKKIKNYLPVIILLLPLLTLYIFSKGKENLDYRYLKEVNQFKEFKTIKYQDMIEKLLNEKEKMAKAQFQEVFLTEKGVKTTINYSKGLTHIHLKNQENLRDKGLIGEKEKEYDIYSFPSDGKILKNRVIACEKNLKNCQDLTVSLLGVPGLYFQEELFEEIYGLDVQDINALLGVANTDPGFWELMIDYLKNSPESEKPYQTPSKVKRAAFEGVKKTKVGMAKCYGYVELDEDTGNKDTFFGWCFKDGIYVGGTSGNTNKDEAIKINNYKKIPFPSRVSLENAAQVITEDMMNSMEQSNIASVEMLKSLKKEPDFKPFK